MKNQIRICCQIVLSVLLILSNSCAEDDPIVPVVATTSVTSITDLTATGGGKVINEGGSPVTSRGVCRNPDHIPTILDKSTSDGAGGGLFTSSITELTPGITYFVRAYATNTDGTTYGKVAEFQTSFILPTVETSAVENITIVTAASGGAITSFGTYDVTSRGVCWSKNPNPTINDYKTSDDSGMGTFLSVQIGSGYTSVAAGGYHTLAIKNDGTLWGWGRNQYGQLGTSTNLDQHLPVKIGP